MTDIGAMIRESFGRGDDIRDAGLTTPEDVLAHIRDYGGYCRRLEAGYRALIDYEKGRP